MNKCLIILLNYIVKEGWVWTISYPDHTSGSFVIFNGDFVVCRFFKKSLFEYFWAYFDDIMKMIIHITSFLETKLYTVSESSNLHVINDDHIFS